MDNLWFCGVCSWSAAALQELWRWGTADVLWGWALHSCWVPGDGKGCREAWFLAAWGWPKPARCWWVFSLQINAVISFVVGLGIRAPASFVVPFCPHFTQMWEGVWCLVKIHILRACEQLTHCWGSGAVGLLRSQNNSIKNPLSFWVGFLGATGLF